MQVLVVMAGRGKRFIDAGYKIPKPVIDIKGKTIVKRTIESLPFVMDLPRSCLTFAVLKEHVHKHSIDKILFKEFGSEINIVVMDQLTSGNLHTAQLAVQELLERHPMISRDETLLILDSDNVYHDTGLERWIINLQNSPIQDWGVICTFDDPTHSIHWCFAETDPGLQDSKVIMLHEKTELGRARGKPMVGTFVFSSISLFLDHAEYVFNRKQPTAGEYYMSQAVQEIIESKIPVLVCHVDRVHPLGTPLDLEKYETHLRLRPKKRFCFDLDDTILHCKKPGQKYGNESPQADAIKILRQLHNDGHYIIIYTARHMNTCDGNVGKVLARQGLTTLEWLNRYNVPYDEIYFGKPHADVFIDDKAYHHDGSWERTERYIQKFLEGDK